MRHRPFIFLVILSALLCLPQLSIAQLLQIDEVEGKSTPGLNRSRGARMLREIKDALETYYYDKNFKGIDIDAKFKEAAEKIKTLETNAQIFRVIAGVLLEFNDSHTRFFPPGRYNRVDYGFTMQVIGDKCFVVDVKKDSDAEKKGIKLGERILKVGQYDVTRDSLWVLNYFIYQLEPMPVLPVTLADEKGAQRTIVVEASIKTRAQRLKEFEARRKEPAVKPFKCAKISAALTACKLSTFSVEKKYIDQMMKEASAGSKLILDLRGNRGGYVKIEEYLTGFFFDREVKIADMISRGKTDTRIAKPVRDRRFAGDLVVLIDSNSASASEVFARLIQIEKRGKIVGDVSAGAVMTSYGLSMAIERGPDGFQTITPYGLNVTVADLVMNDGNRLENVGVVPDHPVGPSPFALAKRTDPVLSFAAGLLGEKFSSEDAGKLEFLFKQIEDDDEDVKTNDEP
ncbi:MAG: S41 family peptidase [Pyrinomonadaceae bacterium]